MKEVLEEKKDVWPTLDQNYEPRASSGPWKYHSDTQLSRPDFGDNKSFKTIDKEQKIYHCEQTNGNQFSRQDIKDEKIIIEETNGRFGSSKETTFHSETKTFKEKLIGQTSNQVHHDTEKFTQSHHEKSDSKVSSQESNKFYNKNKNKANDFPIQDNLNFNIFNPDNVIFDRHLYNFVQNENYLFQSCGNTPFKDGLMIDDRQSKQSDLIGGRRTKTIGKTKDLLEERSTFKSNERSFRRKPIDKEIMNFMDEYKFKRDCLKPKEPYKFVVKKRPIFRRIKTSIPPKQQFRVNSEEISKRWANVKSDQIKRNNNFRKNNSNVDTNKKFYITLWYEINKLYKIH